MKLLVANRGEIAVRIIRAAEDVGIPTVSIGTAAEAGSLHVTLSKEHATLSGSGVQAYLDIDAVMDIAKRYKCTAIHPGYGLLSESPALSRACEKARIAFVGPPTHFIEVFGNKVAARKLAAACGIPVLPGTSRAVTGADEVTAFGNQVGYPVMLKAVAGGGGLGIRFVASPREASDALARCASEAEAAFGDGAVFVEKALDPETTCHVEVQAGGVVVHLWDRDCSLQARHRKVVEMAPAPPRARATHARAGMLAAAVRVAQHAGLVGAATVEFLADLRTGSFFFLEVNPRLQVEHTITEEVTGVDIVAAQLHVAQGGRLRDISTAEWGRGGGIGSGGEGPPARGYAVQLRVSAEEAGVVGAVDLPGGPGVRVDSALRSGGGGGGTKVSLDFDPLLFKVVVRAGTYPQCLARCRRALAELRVEGVATNIPLLRRAVAEMAASAERGAPLTLATLPRVAAAALPPAAGGNGGGGSGGGGAGVVSPVAGTVAEVAAAPGKVVAGGEVVAVIKIMKMEVEVPAPAPGVVAVAHVQVGDTVEAGQLLIAFSGDGSGGGGGGGGGGGAAARAQERVASVAAHVAPGRGARPAGAARGVWAAEVDEMRARRRMAREGGGKERVARQKSQGKLTARERLSALTGPGTFREVGSMAGWGAYDGPGAPAKFTPTSCVGGFATVGGREAAVVVDDFTVRGGHSEAGGGGRGQLRKQATIESLARQMRVPIVRLLDGSSGGGSVKSMLQVGYSYLPMMPGFHTTGAGHALLQEVPVCAVLLGPVVGLGAARAVLSHYSCMVQGTSQLFVAGPPVVREATGEDVTKEELGGAGIQARCGAVDDVAPSEAEALARAARFLSYLPPSAWELPPYEATGDPEGRREEGLLSVVPRRRERVLDIRKLLGLVLDTGSWMELGALWGGSMVTGLGRLGGHVVGVLAQDGAVDGGALTAAASHKLRRHVALCGAFHIPVVSFVDQPGFAVGLAAEREGTIRHGATAIAAIYACGVPWFTVVVRKAYGVAGAVLVDHGEPNARVAWPSGDWGSLPVRGGLRAALRRELEAAGGGATADSRVAEAEAEVEAIRSPLRTAEKFGVEEVIDPRDTRPLLCAWARQAHRVLGGGGGGGGGVAPGSTGAFLP